jgi:hypothetical protein
MRHPHQNLILLLFAALVCLSAAANMPCARGEAPKQAPDQKAPLSFFEELTKKDKGRPVSGLRLDVIEGIEGDDVETEKEVNWKHTAHYETGGPVFAVADGSLAILGWNRDKREYGILLYDLEKKEKKWFCANSFYKLHFIGMKKNKVSGEFEFYFRWVGEGNINFVAVLPSGETGARKALKLKSLSMEEKNYEEERNDTLVFFKIKAEGLPEDSEEFDRCVNSYLWTLLSLKNRRVFKHPRGRDSAFTKKFLWERTNSSVRILTANKSPYKMYVEQDERLVGEVPLVLPPLEGVYFIADGENTRIKIKQPDSPLLEEILLPQKPDRVWAATLVNAELRGRGKRFLIVETVEIITQFKSRAQFYIYEYPAR